MFSMYSHVVSEWIGLIEIIVRSADDFCVIVAVALAMQQGGQKAGMRRG